MQKKDIQTLCIVFGLLIAFASWQFVFRSNQEKEEKLQAENQTLQETVNQLEELEQNKDFYLSETERMVQEGNAILDSFATGLLAEDEIMYLYNMELVDSNHVRVPSVSMGAETEVPYTGTPPEGEYQIQDEGIKLYTAQSSVNFTTDYNGLKNVLYYIYEMPARKAVSSVSLSASDNGFLSGTMALDFYYFTGTQIPYAQVNIPAVETGTDNIFGVRTGTQEVNRKTEEAQQEDEESGLGQEDAPEE